jgi:hypothetical protein
VKAFQPLVSFAQACSNPAMPALKSRQTGIKAQAAKLVRSLPESASWDDLMYEIYVRQKIDNGLADIEAGRVKSHADICKKFGLVA